MYLLLLTFGMCVAYFILFFLYSYFFKNKFTALEDRNLYSVAIIVAANIVAYGISFAIPDRELSNRVLHALGGGFMAFLVCYLVVRDLKLDIGRFQFFIFSFLIVMTMGIGNEVIEWFGQTYMHMIFAATPDNTWLDLVSNIFGALVGGFCFTPFVKK